MAGPIGHIRDPIRMSTTFLTRTLSVKDCTNRAHNINVTALCIAPYGITPPWRAVLKDVEQGANMVFNVQPITDLQALSING